MSSSPAATVAELHPVEIVTVEGNIAVGKSSVLQRLRDLGHYVVPEPTQDWGGLLKLYYEDPVKYSFPLQARILACMTRDRREHVAKARALGFRRIFMERSPMGARVFTKATHDSGNMTRADYETYNLLEAQCRDQAQNRQQHIFLEASVETCHRRCRRRDRPDERSLTTQDKLGVYLTQLHALQLEIFPLDEMVRVDAEQSVGDVARDILAGLEGTTP